MKRLVAVSVLGQDQPGIVAAITKAFYETGCNIEDSTMTQLKNEFAMILLVAVPEKLALAKLKTALAAAARALRLSVSVRPLAPEEMGKAASDRRYVVCVYGADRPGLVYQISSFLAGKKINITDVQTALSTTGNGPVYIMFFEIALPESVTLAAVRSGLAKIARKMQVTVTVNEAETAQL